MTAFRLLTIDDHPVVLAGLRLLLADDPSFMLVGEARSADGARSDAERLQPDLIVADLAMPGADGIALIEDLVATAPGAAILIYSSHDEQLWAPRTLRAGARGYVSKSEPLEAVATALVTIADGGIAVSEAVQRLLVMDFARSGSTGDPAALSAREQQVLDLMGKGYSLQTLGTTLGLSIKTVGTYRERLKVKLGLDSVRALEQVARERPSYPEPPK